MTPGATARPLDRMLARPAIEATAVYSIRDVEQILALSRKTVLQLIERGELSSSRIGRQYRIPGAFLLEFLARASTDPRRAEEALARFAPMPIMTLLARRMVFGPGVPEETAAADALAALARQRYGRR